jgi:hypothetical protein
MNKSMFFCLLFLTVGVQLFAQDGHRQVPASVQRSFQRDYPESRDPQWSMVHGQWHANFNDHSRYDRGEMVAHYDRYGHHVDSHIRYDRNDVPAAVVDRTQRRYPGGRDYSYTRIEHPGGQPLFQISFNVGGRNRTAYVDDNGRERRYNDHH